MKTRTGSIALAIILILIPSLPALAQESDSETITITMTTKTVIEIELEPTNWDIGSIKPEELHTTGATYFTMTNNGNCDLHTYVKGNDVVWSDNPNYKWELSSNGSNGIGIYVLWCERTDYEPIEGLITAEENEFFSNFGMNGGNPKHFGLKLQAPQADYAGGFLAGGEMETTIIISGVAA